jgi:hypothetical protein
MEQEVSHYEQARRDFMEQFELKSDKPGFHGPMVHKVTGESYQGMSARLEYEYSQKHKGNKKA